MKKILVLVLAGVMALSGCSMAPDDILETASQQETKAEKKETEVPTDLPESDEDPYAAGRTEAFLAPWPTEFKRSDAIKSALYDTFEFFDSRINFNCDFKANLIFEQRPETWEQVERISDSIMKIFLRRALG